VVTHETMNTTNPETSYGGTAGRPRVGHCETVDDRALVFDYSSENAWIETDALVEVGR